MQDDVPPGSKRLDGPPFPTELKLQQKKRSRVDDISDGSDLLAEISKEFHDFSQPSASATSNVTSCAQEIDPLDAYMAEITKEAAKPSAPKAISLQMISGSQRAM